MSNPNALAIKAKEITGKINPNVTDEKVIKQVEENLIKEYESLYAPEKELKQLLNMMLLQVDQVRTKKTKNLLFLVTTQFMLRRQEQKPILD